ncbi:MAG TPA: hypothetical protein VHY20_06480, partial [Pirellulales bacterium]|nr:hypothetical protein [Pirellulales bacterium]
MRRGRSQAGALEARDARRKRSLAARRRMLTVELLEDRCLLTTINWNGAGDGTTWNSVANWIGGVVPVAGDAAVIGS